MKTSMQVGFCAAFAAMALVGCASTPMTGKRELMLVANDQKILWDDAGKPVMMVPGKDNVLVVDIGTNPLEPKIIATLPLMNTIFGPPTNLQITPDGKLGLVANSMDWVADGATWKAVPDNKVYVIDLTLDPPKLVDTVLVGKQPSGMAINRAGDLALIANRADNSISVVKITGKAVKLIDTVTVGKQPSGMAINRAGDLALNGDKVTYDKQDIPVGFWPYNLDITQDGGRRDPARLQRRQEGVLLQPQRFGRGAEDRRQEGDANQRSRRRGPTGGPRVQR